MIALHEMNPDSLQSVLTEGLKRSSRGEKGDDALIAKTDKLLDEKRPKELKDQGVSRDTNVYAFVFNGDTVISIKDGKRIPAKEFVTQSNKAIIELNVDPKRCFVSDLDTYDAVKAALKAGAPSNTLDTLTKSYWSKLTILEEFTPQMVHRPEIMVTYDIPPTDIRSLK